MSIELKLPEQFHFAKQHWYVASDVLAYVDALKSAYEQQIVDLTGSYENKIAEIKAESERNLAELRQSHHNDMEDFVTKQQALAGSIRRLLDGDMAELERRSSLLMQEISVATEEPVVTAQQVPRHKIKISRECYDPTAMIKNAEASLDSPEDNNDRQGE